MDDQEYRRLILDHLRLVRIIALKIMARLPAGIELNDLVHTGIIGLIDAVKKFDPAKGVKFATYASLRIRGAILDELRNLDWATRTLRQKIKDMEGTFLQLEQQLGRPPTEEEVARSLDLELPAFHHMLDQAKGLGTGVYRHGGGEDEGELAGEQILSYTSDESGGAPELTIEKEEMKKRLGAFIDELPEREKMVLGLYYVDDLNLKEIAAILNLTESRISQIRTAAILRLRGKIADMAARHRVSSRNVL